MTDRLLLTVLLLFGASISEASGEAVLLDDQFKLPAGFHIYKAADSSLTGGSYDLTFDGQGRLLVGDGEAVRRLTDTDGDQVYDQAEVIARGLGPRGPQGLLVYGDRLYAVGGDGIQLFTGYQSDSPLQLQGRIGEPFDTGGDHSAHAVLRGLDGYVYFVCGDGAKTSDRQHITENSSPVIYERKGCVFRFDPTGEKWECISAGGRNAPSLGMNYLGEFFSLDSDMEWHTGLPWYRPVRLNHWAIGGDQGWQVVGAYPPYYLDCLPPVLEVGRGSPNWGVFYEHTQLPHSYHDSFICCDYRWKSVTTGGYNSAGRLVAFHLTRNGATWQATMETLAEAKTGAVDQDGEAINFALVDIAVAPDGSILLTDHNQGVWRIFYNQATTPTIPPMVPLVGLAVNRQMSLQQLLSLPQPSAEWSRVHEQQIMAQLGDDATALLQAAATHQRPHEGLSLRQRLRAIRYLATEFGALDNKFLQTIASDELPEIRGQAAWLSGIRGEDTDCQLLINLLADADPFVRRRAAEAMGRIKPPCGQRELVQAMGDPDRPVRYAAMTAIAHHRLAQWIHWATETNSPRIWMRALTAGSLRREPPPDAVVIQIIDRLLESELIEKSDQLDRLRVLNLFRPQIGRNKNLVGRVAAHLAAGLTDADREVRWEHAQLVAEYNVAAAYEPLLTLLEQEDDHVTQFHLANSLSRINSGWSPASEARLIKWLMTNQQGWFADLSHKGRGFSLFWLTALDRLTDGHAVRLAKHLDQLVAGSQLSSVAYGEVATTPAGRQKLLDLYERTDDRQLRFEIAKGFSSHTLESKYWPVMSAALESTNHDEFVLGVEWLANQGPGIHEFFQKLPKEIGTPGDGEQVLIQRVVELLEQGHNELYIADRALCNFTATDFDRQRNFHSDQVRLDAVEHWQAWYRDRYGIPFANPASSEATEITSDAQLHKLILTEPTQGDSARGREIYLQAGCFSCHGGMKDKEAAIFGPDLAGVTQRLKREELADALVYPSNQVAQRFKNSLVITDDGQTRTGMVTAETDQHLTLVDTKNRIWRIARGEIETHQPLETSPMPDKVLNRYSKQQIQDLLQFLQSLR
ncbi:MAG: HEAT repeat domain-containing protein [Mariniblastus sp.]|nr:HEAT repeat domain-containing protein [Mariniblastus sp.]